MEQRSWRRFIALDLYFGIPKGAEAHVARISGELPSGDGIPEDILINKVIPAEALLHFGMIFACSEGLDRNCHFLTTFK
ncbi:hypothetical protein [Paenibacillus jiagnxiensis]|uniref:hypothetical protein n=1 Tax=Paenibacillus jiagnxiensis TaxID=3228926 RepID=UPI0033ABF2DD